MLDDDATFFEHFLDEILDFDDGNFTTVLSTSELYELYKKYCREKKQKIPERISFTKELKSYAIESGFFRFIPRKNTKQDSHVIGLKIK